MQLFPFPIIRLLSFFSPSVPIRAEKCLQLKTIVWWRQKCLTGFFSVAKMASSARPKDAQSIDTSIFHALSFSLSGLLSQAESSLQRVTSHIQILMCRVYPRPAWAPLHFALPGLFAVPPCGFLCTGWVRFVWSEQVLEQLNTSKLGKALIDWQDVWKEPQRGKEKIRKAAGL